jgi:hypothetical protein
MRSILLLAVLALLATEALGLSPDPGEQLIKHVEH